MLYINFKGNTPQQRFYTLGVQRNNKANKIRFILEKQQVDLNLSDYVCSLKIESKENEYLDLIMLEKVSKTETELVYEWVMPLKSTQYRNLELQLEFLGDEEIVWQTMIFGIELSDTIKVGDTVDDKELSVLKQMEYQVGKNKEDIADLQDEVKEAKEIIIGDPNDYLNENGLNKIIRVEDENGNVEKSYMINKIITPSTLVVANADTESGDDGEPEQVTYEAKELGSGTTYIETTYDELKELRDNGLLQKGCLYRITDYITTTVQAETRSAFNQFDIVVLALDEKTLSENAWAVAHNGDEYFKDCNLGAWQIKYCLDNDTDKFAWALDGQAIVNIASGFSKGCALVRQPSFDGRNPDQEASDFQYAWGTQADVDDKDFSNFVYSKTPTLKDGEIVWNGAMTKQQTVKVVSGKGVIYYMKDEWDNECPYDFKNIQFRRYRVVVSTSSNNEFNGYYLGIEGGEFTPSGYQKADGSYAWCYTFTGQIGYWDDEDGMVIPNAKNIDNTKICDLSIVNMDKLYNEGNDYAGGCQKNRIGYSKWSTTNISYYNKQFLNNIVFFGWVVDFSTLPPNYKEMFGEDITTLMDMPSCNTFGYCCSDSTFLWSCYGNNFGNYCYCNTMGETCVHNTFNKDCNYNLFGRNNSFNNFEKISSSTFGANCGNNIFTGTNVGIVFAQSCQYNYLDNCHNMNLGMSCRYNVFKTGCADNILGKGCSNITLDQNCRSNNFSQSCQNIHLQSGCNSNIIKDTSTNIKIGTNCNNNQIRGYCINLGILCNSNKIGVNTSSAKCSNVSLGDRCQSNVIKNGCAFITMNYMGESNTIEEQCKFVSIGNNSVVNNIPAYSQNIILENYCKNIKIIPNTTPTSSSYVRKVRVSSNIGDDYIPTNLSIDCGNTFETTYVKDGSTTIIV